MTLQVRLRVVILKTAGVGWCAGEDGEKNGRENGFVDQFPTPAPSPQNNV